LTLGGGGGILGGGGIIAGEGLGGALSDYIRPALYAALM